MAWAGHGVRLLVIRDAVLARRAPSFEARRIRRRYKEVWYRLLSTLGLILSGAELLGGVREGLCVA